jgi:hypothetical protein
VFRRGNDPPVRGTQPRELISKDVANREQLHSEFIKETTQLYRDSLDRTLPQPASLIGMYSLIGHIQLISTEAIFIAAENVGKEIIEAYNRPPMTVQEVHKFARERRIDPRRATLSVAWEFGIAG